MIDIFLDAEFLQQQHTTDTKQDFLLQTVFPVAAIEAVGDGLVKVGVHLVVGIEQIELYTTDINTPHVGMHHIIGIRNIDHQRITILVELTLDGQRTEVLSFVVGNLLTVHRQALSEVAETIEETNGTHVNVRVAGLLHVVASQHSQTARINLQGRVYTILHTEVGNRRALGIGLHAHVLLERGVDVLDALHQVLVVQDFFLTGKSQTFQQHNGVMLHVVIDFRIEVAEQVASLKVPHPPEVVSNLVQTLQLLRKARLHGQHFPLRSICIICFNLHTLKIIMILLVFVLLPYEAQYRKPHRNT